MAAWFLPSPQPPNTMPVVSFPWVRSPNNETQQSTEDNSTTTMSKEKGVNAATKKAVANLKKELTSSIERRLTEIVEIKMEEALKHLQDKLQEAIHSADTRPSTNVTVEEVRAMVKECLADRSIVTTTPASAVHGGTFLSKGFYPTVQAMMDDTIRLNALVDA
jgi:hypothetical protein